MKHARFKDTQALVLIHVSHGLIQSCRHKHGKWICNLCGCAVEAGGPHCWRSGEEANAVAQGNRFKPKVKQIRFMGDENFPLDV